VLELAYEHMNDPELVRIEPDKVTVDRVRQSIYFPSNEEKMPLLIGLLRHMDPARTMVFVNTKRGAERVQYYLEANSIHAEAISGDVPQRKRLRLMRDFLSGELPVLVATDVASRGLHIPDVSHVFNFDLPQDAEDYVHRIGRTARAGAFGDAISFGCEDYAMHLPEIEEFIGHRIPTEAMDPTLLAEIRRPARRPVDPEARDRRPPRGGQPRRGDRGAGETRERREGGGRRQRREGDPPRETPDAGARQERGNGTATVTPAGSDTQTQAPRPSRKRRPRRRRGGSEGTRS